MLNQHDAINRTDLSLIGNKERAQPPTCCIAGHRRMCCRNWRDQAACNDPAAFFGDTMTIAETPASSAPNKAQGTVV